jgi:hypothetical protein
MVRRPLLFVGLAFALASCSKAESKKEEPAPPAAEKTPDPSHAAVTPTPTTGPGEAATGEPPAKGAGEPAKIDPVTVQAKGGGKETAPSKEPAPAPAPAGEADASFQLTVEQPAPVAAGAPATLRVRVTPGTGYKMNAEFPTKLTLEPPAGVTLDKTSLALADAEKFDDHQLAFAVKATAASAGSYTVSGKIKFAVCTDATCDPKKRNISFTVAAK